MPKSATSEPVQSVTLILWGGAFDPNEVTKRLGMRPSRTWARGEQKSFRRPDGTLHYLESVHQWSGWKKWPSDRATRASLEQQLNHWVERLTPRANALRGFRRRGAFIELNCFIAASGGASTQLPAGLIRKIGRLGLDLEITWFSDSNRRSNKRLQPAARR